MTEEIIQRFSATQKINVSATVDRIVDGLIEGTGWEFTTQDIVNVITCQGENVSSRRVQQSLNVLTRTGQIEKLSTNLYRKE